MLQTIKFRIRTKYSKLPRAVMMMIMMMMTAESMRVYSGQKRECITSVDERPLSYSFIFYTNSFKLFRNFMDEIFFFLDFCKFWRWQFFQSGNTNAKYNPLLAFQLGGVPHKFETSTMYYGTHCNEYYKYNNHVKLSIS